MKTNHRHHMDKCSFTIKTLADRFVAQLPLPAKKPTRPSQTQAKSAQMFLNLLCDRLGPDTPAIEVFANPARLKAVYDSDIVNEHNLSPSTLRSRALWMNRFVKFGWEVCGLPTAPYFPLPKANWVRTTCPTPDVVAKMMAEIVVTCSEILAFTILLGFYGLRAEEAYVVLANLRSHLAAPWLTVPGTSKGRVRMIRHRFTAKVWMESLLATADPTKTDFRPRSKNGHIMPVHFALMQLQKVLRDQNPKMGRISSYPLRKCWISACASGNEDLREVIREAGLPDRRNFHHHYNCKWTREMGESYWAIRPPGKSE